MRKILLYIMSFCAAMAGCKSSAKGSDSHPQDTMDYDWTEATMVEYNFNDASVAPEYHRSYTITVSEKKKTVKIHCYGDVLLSRDYDNTPEEYLAFRNELSEKGIKKLKPKKNVVPCDGGTTETLKLYKGDECYFNGYVDNCSNGSTIVLPGSAVQLIKRQITDDIDSLINSTIENRRSSRR